MNQAVSPPFQRNSRLVRLLSDLALIEESWPHRDFADRLGQLLSFGDSILLSDAHKVKPEKGFSHSTESSEELKQSVLHTKSTLVNRVIESCTPEMENPRIRWPAFYENAKQEASLSYDPMLRFYATHQREQDLAIRVVRSSARDTLSGYSPALKKLSVLDQVLEETLFEPSFRFFALIPRLLEKRFSCLQEERKPRWLNQFRKDVQALLLAELDLRLQPVLGLVEALEKEEKKHP